MILADIDNRNCLEVVVKEVKFFGSEIALVLALVVGTALGVGLGWFTFPHLFPLFQNSGLAAWVQAIGSILAVLIAVQVAKSQANTSRSLQAEQLRELAEERKRNNVRSLRAIELTVQVCMGGVRRACQSLSEMDMNNYLEVKNFVIRMRPGVEISNLAVDRLLVYEYPGVMLAPQVLSIKLGFNKVLELFDRIEKKEMHGVLLEAQGIRDDLSRFRAEMAEIVKTYDGAQEFVRKTDP